MPVAKIDHVDEIDEARVRHVALLSRLELSPELVTRFARELTGIIHHINKLEELDLEGVPPTSHPMPLTNVFRPDVNRPSLSNEDGLRNAPEQQDECFKVPQII